MSIRSTVAPLVAALSIGALAACSGGGGGTPPVASSANPGAGAGTSPTAAPTPTATPIAPQSATVSGTVVDLPYDASTGHSGYSVLANGNAAVPGAAISGARVYVGAAVVSGATAPSAVPAGYRVATTSASGAFSIANVPLGHLAITIFAPAPHVTIVHQDLFVAADAAAGTYMMTVPSAAEAAWFAQENVDRSAFSMPATLLDESVLEAARYWAQFMQANSYFAHCIPASRCVTGDGTPAPASYGPQDVDPQHRYAYFHGYSSGSEGENIAGGFATWQNVDSTFMAEQSLCPNASPANCPFNENTGHFLNIVDPNYVWTGVGIASLAGNGPFYDQEFTLLNSTSPTATDARFPPGNAPRAVSPQQLAVNPVAGIFAG